ncbi:hypothetical protein GJAV_G00017470 [Gymnothorax javanicus]|nr:hypothetical protein GJAV_G00017470 [Gymnothorax javanicus]
MEIMAVPLRFMPYKHRSSTANPGLGCAPWKLYKVQAVVTRQLFLEVTGSSRVSVVLRGKTVNVGGSYPSPGT